MAGIDLDRTIEAIKDKDIVCLQEVTTNWRVCNRDDQPEFLATGLNRFTAYAPAYQVDGSHRNSDGSITNSRLGFGNMVLSRWPIIYSRAHSLPRPRTDIPPDFHPSVDFPRTALEAVIDIEGTALRVVSVHLSQLPGAQRDAQIDVLKTLAMSLPGEAALWQDAPRISIWSEDRPAPQIPKPTLLIGDFNFEPEDPGLARMIAPAGGRPAGLIDGWADAGLRRSDARTSVENDGRLARLDYMFMTPDMAGSVHSARVDQSTKASDHYPVCFLLEI